MEQSALQLSGIIDASQTFVREGKVGLRGRFDFDPSFKEKVLNARAAIEQFLRGLNGARKLSVRENGLIQSYGDVVSRGLHTLEKVFSRVRERGIETPSIENLDQNGVTQLVFEYASQLNDVIGWMELVAPISPYTMQIAAISMNYYSVALLKELSSDPEFAELAGNLSIFKHAVTNCVTDPRGFLRRTLKIFHELQQEEEFAEFHDIPWILMDTAVGFSNDPRRRLRALLKTIEELKNDDEFIALRKIPMIFRHATLAFSYPRCYLRNVLDDMENSQEHLELRDVMTAAGYPSDP